MVIPVHLGANSYDIVVQRGALSSAGQHLNLNRKVLVVTDSGVPAEYARALASQAKESVTVTVQMGEDSKSLATYKELALALLSGGFSRGDCVVAVGGGVVGDLAGFVASTYMRGIDFYNVPTTLLSQIDSSIGGKVAVNLEGVKNIIGAFYQPKKVLIDPDVLKTLPARQLSSGLAEAIKMALTFDRTLFELIENGTIKENIDEIITRSLIIKKEVVEKDEKESGLRRVLNFGHTVGHGIESVAHLYHGECVALGMLAMCEGAVRERLLRVLEKVNLPTQICCDGDSVYQAMLHDKKASGDSVYAILVPEVGSFEMKKIPIASLKERVSDVVACKGS